MPASASPRPDPTTSDPADGMPSDRAIGQVSVGRGMSSSAGRDRAPCLHPKPGMYVELLDGRIAKVCRYCAAPLEPAVDRCPAATARGTRCRLPVGHRLLRQWRRQHGASEAVA